MQVLAAGADGCKAGWVVAWRHEQDGGQASALGLQPSFASLLDWQKEQGSPPLAVDVPIGLESNGGSRPCDAQLRALLKNRASSVFSPPGRFLLKLHDRPYREIRAEVERRQASGQEAQGISAQAAALLPKIHEVDVALRADPSRHETVFEVHPELCFQRATGVTLAPKRSPAGQLERLAFVEGEFGAIEPLLADPRWHSADADLTDVLDAFAALTTALRWPNHVEVLGGETDDEGRPKRMVVQRP